MDVCLLAGASVCALLAVVWDLRRGRIPNRLVYGAMLGALAVRAGLIGGHSLLDGIAAGLVGGGILFLFFLAGGMGAGDVKLMAAVGTLSGLRHLLVILLTSSIAGGLLALGYIILSRRGMRTLRNLGTLLRYHLSFGVRPHPTINLQNPESARIPYAVAIAAGTVYAFVTATLGV